MDYSATKGAIHAFTKSLAKNLVSSGIRVNCVAPGPVWTPLNPSDRDADDVAHFGENTPMERPAEGDDRKEEKLDLIIKKLYPGDADKIFKELEKSYPHS